METTANNIITNKTGNNIQSKKFICRDLNILVVDNSEPDRRIVCEMLSGYGISTDVAEFGERAVRLAREHKYDMIFMNQLIPDMDAAEAARRIYDDSAGCGDVPMLILLCDAADAGNNDIYRQSGFEDFIKKPVEEGCLHDFLERMIPEGRKQYLNDDYKEDDSEDIDIIKLFMSDIDVITAVNNNGGIDSYMDLLDLFYTDAKQRKGSLAAKVESSDFKNYTIEVHGLKSAAANIGANILSELAKKHETAGNNSDYAYIRNNMGELFDEYQKVVSEIERILKQQGYGQFAGNSEELLPAFDAEMLLGEIRSILSELESFNSKEAALKNVTLLGHALPDNVRKTLEEVSVLLKVYEDDEAEDKLKELINEIENGEK